MSPCFCFLWVLLLFLLPLVCSQVEDLTILSSTGDGTCININPVAVNCTLPFTLTLTLVNLPLVPPLGAYQASLQITGGGTRIVPYTPNNSNTTSTSISFLISGNPFYLIAGRLLNVTLMDQRNYANIYRSPTTPSFSLFPYPAPEIFSVSGCQGNLSPLVTTGCYPDVDILTLTGVGFELLSYFGMTTKALTMGVNGRSSCCFSKNSPGITIYNDTVMTLTLLDSFNFLFIAEHFSGIPVSIWFSWNDGYTTNKFNITMAALPPPIITSWWASNQPSIIVNNVTIYPSCIPGITQVTVIGYFLYNGTLSVGGLVCDTSRYSAFSGDRVICDLPIIEPNINGTMYDITFQNLMGSVTVPKVIGFTEKPTLNAVTLCWSDGGLYTFNNNPFARCAAGNTLILTGRSMMFAGLTLLNITLTPFYGATTSLSCLNPTVVNDTTISCILPYPNSSSYISQAIYISSLWSGGYVSNSLYWVVYDYLDAPRILSVSGCGGQTSDLNTGLSLSNCIQGDMLTLTGYNFDVNIGWSILSGVPNDYWSGSWYCSPVVILSNTSLTCQLPTAAEFPEIDWNVAYSAIAMPTNNIGYGFATNAFYVTFVSLLASSSSSSSSGSSLPPVPGSASSNHYTMVVAVSSALTVVGVIVIVAGVWWVWRRREGGEGGGRGNGKGKLSGGNGSEQEDKTVALAHSRNWTKMSTEMEMGNV